MVNLSFTDRINRTKYGQKQVTIEEVFNIIRTGDYLLNDPNVGNYTLRQVTEYIQGLSDHTEQNEKKLKYLPAVSFNGRFRDGDITNDGLEEYSNLTALDFDGFKDQEAFQWVWRRLAITPCVYAVFQTPSGRGLKAVILHDNIDPSLHEEMYLKLLDKFRVDVAINDASCKDLRRLHYLCYDPCLYVNPSPVPYHFEPAPSVTRPSSLQESQRFLEIMVQQTRPAPVSDESAMAMVKAKAKKHKERFFCEGERHNGCYWFGTEFAKAGVDYVKGLWYVINLYESDEVTNVTDNGMPREEIIRHFKRGYENSKYEPGRRAKLVWYKHN